MRIAVVGAGISGLTVAYLLSRAGHDVSCLDRAERPGGLIRSERRQGFLCETGPQAVLDGAPEVRALIDDAGLASRAVPASRTARKRYIYTRGKLRAVPSGPFSLMSSDLLSASGKWRLMQEPFAKTPPPAEDESVLAFATRRIGDEAATHVVAPAVIGIFAGDAAKLSVRSAFPRLAALEASHGSVLKGLRAARKEGAGPGRLSSFQEGLEELPRAIAEKLGGRFMRTGARSIAPEGAGWRVETDAGKVLRVEKVVVALGARATASLIEPLAPAASAALRAIPLAPVAVVWLGFDHADLGLDLDSYGFLVARGEGHALLGCQYESSIFPGRAPEGGVLLRAIMGGTFAPALLDEPDEAIIARALQDLRPIGGLRAEPTFRGVWRHPAAIPQYELGHEGRVRTVEEAIAGLPGLFVTGNALRGVGIADCIRNATALARQIGTA